MHWVSFCAQEKKLASNFDSSAKTAIKIGTELYVAVRPKIVSYLSK